MKTPYKRLLVGIVVLVVTGVIVLISSQKPASNTFTRLDDGVIVKIDQPQAGGAGNVKLQVVNDKIIHVTAAAGDSFAAAASLMTDDQKRHPEWKLEEQGDQLV